VNADTNTYLYQITHFLVKWNLTGKSGRTLNFRPARNFRENSAFFWLSTPVWAGGHAF